MKRKSLWYCARLVFHTQIAGSAGSLKEDSWVLIQAGSESAARRSAQAIGRKRQHAYKNGSGEEVVWLFREVVEIQEIDGPVPAHGVEVFSELNDAETASR